jgi:hypothetical protein
MSTVHSVHLTMRVRLLELCEAEGFENIDELLEASICDSVCPAFCMDCGCTAEMEPDQRAGYCEQCGRNMVVSCLILAGLIWGGEDERGADSRTQRCLPEHV